ncbi:MAG: hypothetical protein AB1556_08135 [Bacillota bacterium]
MSQLTPEKRRFWELAVYLVAFILMIVRVDWWWWGWKIEPYVFGWLTLPMLYQVGIWLIGWLLIYFVVKYLWIETK